jgi:outer membrane protein OmpA-like peptidoglycan-associated protein
VPPASLKSYVAGSGQVFKSEDRIAYNIESDVLFDFGEATRSARAKAVLDQVAAKTKARPIRPSPRSGSPATPTPRAPTTTT